jgi:hypothetical protein
MYNQHVPKAPISKGERIVVCGYARIEAYVEDVVFQTDTRTWKIIVDWGPLGKSHVWNYDEGNTWYRYSVMN